MNHFKRQAISVDDEPIPQPVMPLDSEDEDDDIVQGPQFRQVGIPSRKRERDSFRDPPQPRHKCFGCIYKDGEQAAELPKRRLDRLMKKLTNCIGQMDEIALFREVAQEYDTIRSEVNARLRPGQRKLPKWKPATIAEHMREHHDDPQFHLWLMTKNHRKATDIALQAAIRQDQRTGEVSIDKDQWKCYLDGMKMLVQLMKTKPAECAFFNDGKKLNVKAMSQGPVAITFKPIVDMLKSGNRR